MMVHLLQFLEFANYINRTDLVENILPYLFDPINNQIDAVFTDSFSVLYRK